MKLVALSRHFKPVMFGIMLVGSSLLSGCAGMMNKLGYTQIEQPATQACTNAPVLMTNLTVDAHHRHYQLPDGRACPGVNYYEQYNRQAERAAARNRF